VAAAAQASRDPLALRQMVPIASLFPHIQHHTSSVPRANACWPDLRSGRAVQFGAQLDRIDTMCPKKCASGINGADSPAELAEVLAPPPAKLGAIRVIEIA
jgi:hypothetical protein